MAKLKNGTTIGGSTAWHAGNDGSGSGLNADLLDGQQGSYYTGYTDTAIANLVDSSPATLDTLNELAGALGDDPNFATTVTNSIATKLNSSAYTASDVLTKIKTVDGSGSGLDADTVDGIQGSSFLRSDADDTINSFLTIGTGKYIKGSDGNPLVQVNGSDAYFGSTGRATTVLASSSDIVHNRAGTEYAIWTAYNDGSGSGLDADTVDGLHASAFQPAGTYNTIIGTDTDINTSGSTIIDNIYVTDGVITSMGTRTLTASDIGAAASSHTHSYLPLSGGSMTGLLAGRTTVGSDVNTNNDTGSFSIRGNSSNAASVSFHRAGAYAVNMGLGTDNVFRIGGWSAAANRLQMDMSGNLTMAGDVTAYSDERLKSDIHTIPNALEKLTSLRGVNYIKDGKESTGVIAQEVEKVLPQVVHTAEDEMGTKSVAYGNMIGLLIEAIKEQQAQINELKNKLEGN
jgi:hypothetical protein